MRVLRNLTSAAGIIALLCVSGCQSNSSGGGGSIAPTITTQPVSQSVQAGQTATFSVVATGTAPLMYQWSKSGNVISGATSSSYTTPATTTADNGSTFQVTVSNAAGSAQSAKATLTVASGSGSGPVDLVQHVSGSNTRNNTFASPFCYHFQLPNPTIAGNAVVVSFTFNSNPTPSVSDDKANSYTVQINHFDSADSQSIGIATAFNVMAGARVIKVCFSADPGGFVQPMATEFDSVTGVDGSAVAIEGSGTSVSPGTLTPTVTGDLAYQVVYSLSTSQIRFTAGSQSNISWNLLSADLMDGWAAQSGQYNSTVAFAPALTMGSSQKWISAGLLLKTGATGGVRSGMHIVHLLHENIPDHAGSGGTGPFPNPTHLQFPSSGNLLVAMMGGGNNSAVINSMSDSKNNSWVQAGMTQVINSNDTVQAFYAGSANSSGDLALTLNWSANDGDFTIFFYDVAGAAASPLDAAATMGATGTQNTNGNLTVFSITPAAANELIFAETVWDFNTGAGMQPAGSFFDTNTFDGESQSGPEPVDENNNWGHIVTTGTAPITITWQVLFPNQLPVGSWAGMAVAFKSGP